MPPFDLGTDILGLRLDRLEERVRQLTEVVAATRARPAPREEAADTITPEESAMHSVRAEDKPYVEVEPRVDTALDVVFSGDFDAV